MEAVTKMVWWEGDDASIDVATLAGGKIRIEVVNRNRSAEITLDRDQAEQLATFLRSSLDRPRNGASNRLAN